MKHELRYGQYGLKVETRAVNGKDARVLSGYAAVYFRDGDPKTEFKVDRFTERMAPGCFDAMIAENQDVRALWNHDPSVVLGRRAAATLRLAADATGLHYECDLPDTQAARDLAVSVERGDVDGSSFAFQVRTDAAGGLAHTIEKRADGSYVRTIRSVNVLDISPVTFPAYAGTSTSVRDLEAATADMELQLTEARAAELAAKAAAEDLTLRMATMPRGGCPVAGACPKGDTCPMAAGAPEVADDCPMMDT